MDFHSITVLNSQFEKKKIEKAIFINVAELSYQYRHLW